MPSVQGLDFVVTCQLIRHPSLVCSLPVASLPAATSRGLCLRRSVRRVSALLWASFRPRLTATPLPFATTFLLIGGSGDFHPVSRAPCQAHTSALCGGALATYAAGHGWQVIISVYKLTGRCTAQDNNCCSHHSLRSRCSHLS